MLTAAERWGGGEGERPFLPRAFSVLRADRPGELQFLIEDVGPGTKRLCELDAGRRAAARRSARERVRAAARGPRAAAGRRRRRDRAARDLAGRARWRPSPTLLGFRDAAHAAGAALLATPTVATDDGSVGHHGLVTELLADELDARADERRGVRVRPAGDARGGPGDLRASAPSRLSWRSSPAWRAGSAPASGASCRPATATSACASTAGARRARCSRPLRSCRSRTLSVDFCGLELAHPIINGSGTFDAIAAQRAFGDELLERFPFAAFVSKTVTLEPRQGNPPPRLWELAGGLINSIGLPNKGLHGTSSDDLPELATLPVPLIVNVMGFSRDEVAELVDAFAERAEVSGARAERLVPERRDRAGDGRRPARGAALLDRVRPLTDKPLIVKLTPNATDVAAVARAAQEAGASAAVADQHAARDGARSPNRRAVARRRHRRRLRAGGPADRARAGARGGAGGRDPDRRDGRRPARPRRARSDARRRRLLSPSAPRASAIRRRGCGSPRSCSELLANTAV